MSDDIICCFLDSCLHSVTRFEIASTDDLKNPIESGMWNKLSELHKKSLTDILYYFLGYAVDYLYFIII